MLAAWSRFKSLHLLIKSPIAAFIALFVGWCAYWANGGPPSLATLFWSAVVILVIAWAFDQNRPTATLVLAGLVLVGYGLGWGWFSGWLNDEIWAGITALGGIIGSFIMVAAVIRAAK